MIDLDELRALMVELPRRYNVNLMIELPLQYDVDRANLFKPYGFEKSTGRSGATNVRFRQSPIYLKIRHVR